MTAEIVNLRKARKARERAEREARAEENRTKHGRTRAERDMLRARSDLESRRLEGHRLGREDSASMPDIPKDET